MALVPTQPPIHWAPVSLSLGVKRPGCETDHSPPSSAKVRVELNLHFPNTPSWHGAQLKHGDNFIFNGKNICLLDIHYACKYHTYFEKKKTIWIRRRESSVGIAIGYGLDDRGSIPGKGRIFLFATTSRPPLGSTQHPTKWVTGVPSSGIKQLGEWSWPLTSIWRRD
jgi:hypothetical protein